MNLASRIRKTSEEFQGNCIPLAIGICKDKAVHAPSRNPTVEPPLVGRVFQLDLNRLSYGGMSYEHALEHCSGDHTLL